MKAAAVIAISLMVTTPAFAKTQVVSWYGQHWAGRQTANGERFNPHKLTAASKTLPMGTRVLLRYGKNTVVVRINDRGPYIKGRGLDVSEAAAAKLGIKTRGVAGVAYSIVKNKNH